MHLFPDPTTALESAARKLHICLHLTYFVEDPPAGATHGRAFCRSDCRETFANATELSAHFRLGRATVVEALAQAAHEAAPADRKEATGEAWAKARGETVAAFASYVTMAAANAPTARR